MAPCSSSSTRGAISSCTHRMRSAEQRWPALLNAEAMTSATTCSGSALESTIIAFSPPVSAMKGTMRAVARGERAVDGARRRGRAGEGDAATRGSATSARADGLAAARHERERIGGQCRPRAAAAPRANGDERRLLRGLGDHGIAGGERRGDLAGEDREREIPRADAHERRRARQAEVDWIRRSGPGSDFGRGEMPAREHRVVAAEVHRLAHFAQRVGQRLARLAREQRHQLGAVSLDAGRRRARAIAARSASGMPRATRRPAPRRQRRIGFLDHADGDAARGIAHSSACAAHLPADQGARLPVGARELRRHRRARSARDAASSANGEARRNCARSAP